MKVLVAEDDKVTRHLLESTLKSWDYDVCTAADGAEALRILEDPAHPEVALMDWQMPVHDGPEVCRILRAKPQTIPVYIILLTSIGGSQNIVRGLESGADDYVIKPFDRGELRARLDVGRRIVELQLSLARRVAQLEDALARVKQLQGLLPICSYCKKIRNDNNYWQQVEGFIKEHSEARFSHGICPDCFEKIVKPELEGLDPKL
jgi:sigma-B regulation protein RsbU (phosphoserine phosphatase)